MNVFFCNSPLPAGPGLKHVFVFVTHWQENQGRHLRKSKPGWVFHLRNPCSLARVATPTNSFLSYPARNTLLHFTTAHSLLYPGSVAWTSMFQRFGPNRSQAST